MKKMVAALLLIVTPAFADPGIQAIFEEEVAPELYATWVVVDNFPAREVEAKGALKKASLEARATLDQLDPLNPLSEMAQLLAKKEGGIFSVSPGLAKILDITQSVAKTIGEPLAKQIKVDLKKNEVKLKSGDVIINIEPLLKGYLADQMMETLNQQGFPNSLLELAGVFITRGQDFNGPWKIQVVDETTENAHHAFLYQAFNTAAATVHYNFQPTGFPNSDLKSITVFTQSGACKAQGVASALYAMGLQHAQKLLDDFADVDRAVLIDLQGKFYQYPEGNGTKQ